MPSWEASTRSSRASSATAAARGTTIARLLWTRAPAAVGFAAAVLGGCSLRGGAGSIIGVLIGAALMRVLRNTITLVDWIPTHIEYAVIGIVILGGVTVDELLKRIAAKRRAAADARRDDD